MHLMIVGASRGLGRAFVQGLGGPGDIVVGVSRQRPALNARVDGPELTWIEADLADPRAAARAIAAACPPVLDVLIYNVGIWEAQAFTADYDFEHQDDDATLDLVNINVAAPLLLLRRLMPQLAASARPRVILTGSTSGLARSGRPEVAFGASKAALNGIADALREGFRDRRLGVTCLQLGDLNTDDGLDAPRDTAAARDDGRTVPVHDVVHVVRTLLELSDASFVRELVMPAIADPRF
ncbi:SDR family NAD(P)-dependent oxidoreductase [Luteimonas sp. TWI1416]|uniref:SDR family NAD(P)-dependent oxidoreductase n=1 Tax=unclassified Luteimonas TaxID=2629088 RepID=UPI00320A354D